MRRLQPITLPPLEIAGIECNFCIIDFKGSLPGAHAVNTRKVLKNVD
jgi:hypothetical protein